MWRGWNSATVEDKLPVQNIGYLRNITSSPTQLNVVNLTMERSEKIRQELGQKYMLICYDLAISKLSYRIQKMESPKFDKLFIETGPFHIRCSKIAGIGYYLTGSGLDELLVTPEILGSLWDPLAHSYVVENEMLQPLWFTGDRVPDELYLPGEEEDYVKYLATK